MSYARPGALRVAAAACLMLWSLSLALPAVAVAGGPSLDGFDMLRQGWRALASGVPSWIANPVFVLACVAGMLGRPRTAGALGGAACLFALTTFAAPGLAERSGRGVPEVVWQVGFYCWLFAQVSLLLVASIAAAVHRCSATRNKLPRSGSFRD